MPFKTCKINFRAKIQYKSHLTYKMAGSLIGQFDWWANDKYHS